jgi:hypothetical protein
VSGLLNFKGLSVNMYAYAAMAVDALAKFCNSVDPVGASWMCKTVCRITIVETGFFPPYPEIRVPYK